MAAAARPMSLKLVPVSPFPVHLLPAPTWDIKALSLLMLTLSLEQIALGLGWGQGMGTGGPGPNTRWVRV